MLDEQRRSRAVCNAARGPSHQRGLFAYDWWDTVGPYRRIAVPGQQMHIDALPSLSELGDLLMLRTSFDTSDTVDFSSLGIDLFEYPRHPD